MSASFVTRNGILELMVGELNRTGKFSLPGVGRFRVVEHPSAGKTVKFRPGTRLEKSVTSDPNHPAGD